MNRCQKLSSISGLTLKSKANNSHSAEVISKYCTQTTMPDASDLPSTSNSLNGTKEENEQSYVEIECPYKSFLVNIDNVKIDNIIKEDNDFKTPKRVTRQTVLKSPCHKNVKVRKASMAANKKRKLVDKRSRHNQMIFTRNVTSLQSSDVNLEHLQLALALSKSQYDQFKTEIDKTIDLSKSTISQTLEQFGFTAGNKCNVEHRRFPIERKKKTSKFRFVTPTLFIRTEADRQQLISEKVSSILSENFTASVASTFDKDCDETLLSHNLETYRNKNADLFKLSALDFPSTQDNQIFYIKTLASISPSSTKCGSLLRDWHTIPGRPLSPISIKTIPETVSNICDAELENKMDGSLKRDHMNDYHCISPDLFETDDEEIVEESKTLLTGSKLSKYNEQSVSTHVDVLQDEYNLNFDVNSKSNMSSENCELPDQPYLQPSLFKVATKSPSTNIVIDMVKGTASSNEGISESMLELDKIHCDLKDSVVDILDLTCSSDEELNSTNTVSKDSYNQDSRQSTGLNVTDYIHSLLSQQQELNDKEVLDLTQNSPEHALPDDQNDTILYLTTSKEDCNIKSSLSTGINFSECNQKDTTISDGDILRKCNTRLIKSSDHCMNDKTPKSLSSNFFNASSKETKIHINTENSKPGCSSGSIVTTPKNKITIKTTNVTPMMNFNEMPTPKIQEELTKFGIKPFNRHKGVKILKHIYEATHPLLNELCTVSDDEDARVLKRKSENSLKKKRTFKKHKSEPCIKPSYLFKRLDFGNDMQDLPEETLADSREFNFIGNQNVEILENPDVGVNPDDLIFETFQSKKIPSCKIPFHIVFHNLVSANPKLREKILLYEPIKSADLYKNLQELGYRFNLKDIESFLHRKCITIRTKQKQSHPFGAQKKK